MKDSDSEICCSALENVNSRFQKMKGNRSPKWHRNPHGIHPFERCKLISTCSHGLAHPARSKNRRAAAMRMQVSEQGDEVFIELSGVAGRHQRILQALTEGPIARATAPDEQAITATDISVRAGANEMHIRVKARAANHFQALSIYHYLRHVLLEREATPASNGALAVTN